MPDYIPRRDAAIRDWATNFSAQIAANPYAVGLMPSDAEAIAGVAAAFDAALSVALSPDTRTAPTVAAKDAHRAAMLSVLRQYAQRIKLNRGVSNEQKIGLGITVDAGRAPIPAPATAPICMVLGGPPLRHTLRYHDSSSPTRRAKPPGATGLEIHYAITPAKADALSPDRDTKFYGLATHQPVQIQLNHADVGKQATYFARWISRKGLAGPWSLPVSMTVAA